MTVQKEVPSLSAELVNSTSGGKAGGKADVEKHIQTKKHQEQKKDKKSQLSLDDFKPVETYNVLMERVYEAQLRYAGFLAEHKIAILAADQMPHLFRKMFPDSEIAKQFHGTSTKTTAIINNVTGEFNKEKINDILRRTKFSLLVDEGTDVSAIKSLCMIVRVKVDNVIKDLFYDLIPVPKCDAISLYAVIVDSFTKNNVSYRENLIGYGADGAYVVTGCNHSVATLLKTDVPDLLIMKCICHSFHRCASESCEKLPHNIEKFYCCVYNYFKSSYSRISLYKEFQ